MEWKLTGDASATDVRVGVVVEEEAVTIQDVAHDAAQKGSSY